MSYDISKLNPKHIPYVHEVARIAVGSILQGVCQEQEDLRIVDPKLVVDFSYRVAREFVIRGRVEQDRIYRECGVSQHESNGATA